jgi:transcriptional regulator with XRE-family HTH domain
MFKMLDTVKLCSLRTASGKSQQEIADLLHITRTAYNKYENGKSQPPLDKITLLANIFGVSSDFLLGLSDDIKPEQKEKLAVIGERSKAKQAFIDFIDTLPDEQAEKLFGIARSIVHMQP